MRAHACLLPSALPQPVLALFPIMIKLYVAVGHLQDKVQMHLSSGGFVIPSCPPESQGAQVVEGNGHSVGLLREACSHGLCLPVGWRDAEHEPRPSRGLGRSMRKVECLRIGIDRYSVDSN